MTTDATNQPAEPTPAAPPEPAVLGRGTGGGLAVFAVLALAVGIRIYTWQAPDLSPGIAGIELGGADQGPLAYPHDVRVTVGWDFVLIAGYGTALLCGAWLARRVFWSPMGRRIGRWCGPLAVLTIAADLVENLLLLRATRTTETWWLDAVAAVAVVKFCVLLATGALAAAAVLTVAVRLVANRTSRMAEIAGRPVTVHRHLPIETDPEQPRGAGSAADDAPGAGRWWRGYLVPGIEDEIARRTAGEPVVGICLSGGGVRSASVSLGALQALRSRLCRARYLASVSGGGYTAGAFQLAMTDAGAERLDPRRQGTAAPDPATAFQPGSVEEDRFRRHASYIANSPAQMLVALGVLGRVVLLSIVVLFGPAIVLGGLVGRWYGAVPLVAWPDGGLDPTADAPFPPFPDIATATWWVVCGLIGIALLCYAVTVIAGAYRTEPVTWARTLAVSLTALALFVAGIAIALPSVVYGATWVLHKFEPSVVTVGGPVGSVVLAYVTTVVALGRRKTVRTAAGGLFKKKRGSPVAAVPSGALQLLLVVVALVVLGAGWLLLFGGAAGVAQQIDWWQLVVLAAALAFLGGALDQTSLSLHPFYRRRLAGAFAARRVVRPDGHTVALGYDYGERTTLSGYAARATVGGTTLPEPVYAAAANLTGEERAPFNAVSFTFTADWVGGPDVGYVRTAELQDAVKEQIKRDLTVQAAVAISGAAVATAMGRSGRWFGSLLAVTGARLGTWLPNPGHVARWQQAVGQQDWTIAGPPRLRRLPYLIREVLGNHSIDDRLLQVTDGGHYENLGLVELFRRRCTRIYCIDSSGDGPPTAGTLAAAVTLAYEELGVKVDLPPENMWKLVIGSGAPLANTSALSGLNGRLSADVVVSAPFTYPPESGLPEDQRTGHLFVAKAMLTPDMDYDVLSYAARNAVFPHDSTGDQFFDDDKYCAYTALGRELGRAMERTVAAYETETAAGAQPPSGDGPPPQRTPKVDVRRKEPAATAPAATS